MCYYCFFIIPCRVPQGEVYPLGWAWAFVNTQRMYMLLYAGFITLAHML